MVSESKFNMWRACVAIIHADGKVDPAEQKWFNERIDFGGFSEEQRSALKEDMQTGVSFSDVIGKVTEKKDRAFLLSQVRVISNLDHDFSDVEKNIYHDLEKDVLADVDVDHMEEVIADMEQQSFKEDENYKNHNKNSWMEWMFNSFTSWYPDEDHFVKKD